MTRFSNPKSIMRFSAKVPALVHIPTPLGTQHFLTDTSLFAHDQMDRQLIFIIN